MVGAGLVNDLYPTPIAAVGDVIAVTMNYRLGALGFLSTSELSTFPDERAGVIHSRRKKFR